MFHCRIMWSFSLFVGSTIDSNFNNVHILHVQEDPANNPYFALNNQTNNLYAKTSINLTQVREYY